MFMYSLLIIACIAIGLLSHRVRILMRQLKDYKCPMCTLRYGRPVNESKWRRAKLYKFADDGTLVEIES